MQTTRECRHGWALSQWFLMNYSGFLWWGIVFLGAFVLWSAGLGLCYVSWSIGRMYQDVLLLLRVDLGRVLIVGFDSWVGRVIFACLR